MGRGDLIDEYRRQTDSDDYFERTEQARHRRGDIFQRRKERSVGKQAASLELKLEALLVAFQTVSWLQCASTALSKKAVRRLIKEYGLNVISGRRANA